MKKLAAIIIVLFLLFLIRSILFSISNLLKNEKTIFTLNQDLFDKKRENIFLTEKLHYVKSKEFIEQSARDKLGLVRQGELIVVAPPPPPASRAAEVKKEKEVNWKKWQKLFF